MANDFTSFDPVVAPDITPYDNQLDPYPVTETTADLKSKKINYALREDSPGTDNLKNMLLAGDEQNLRKSYAAVKDVKDYQNNLAYLDFLTKQAASSGTLLSPEEVQRAQLLTQPVKNDPSTVIEKTFAERLMEDIPTLPGENAVRSSLEEDTPKTVNALDSVSRVTSFREYAADRKYKVDDTLSKQSWYETAGDVGKQLIPFYNWYKYDQALSPYLKTINLPGNTLQEGVDWLLNRPSIDEFKKHLDPIIDRLAQDNPSLASTFLEAVMGRSSSDQVMDNLSGVADLLSAGLSGAKAAIKAVDMMKGVSKAAAVTGEALKVENIVSEAGKIEEAAVIRTSKKMTQPPALAQNQLSDLTVEMPNIMRPGEASAGWADRELASRVEKEANKDKANFLDTLNTTAIPRTITPEVFEPMVQNALNRVKNMYPKLDDMVVDVDIVPFKDKLLDTWQAEIRMGYSTGEFFPTPKAAREFASYIGMKPGEYQVGTKGTSNYIYFNKPLRETDTFDRDLVITLHNTTPRSWWNTVVGGITGSDYSLSKFNNENRILAAYAPSRVREVYYETGKQIGALPKQQRNDLQRVLNYNNVMEHPLTGERGYFYKTFAELDDGYKTILNRRPNPDEISAYFAAVRLNEMDYFLRNLALTKGKMRQGVESMHMTVRAKDGTYVKVDPFDGRYEFSLPTSKEDANVLVVRSSDSKSGGRLFRKNDIPESVSKEIEDGVASGKLRIIQVHAPLSNPLKNAIDVPATSVNYIVTDLSTSRPLTYKQIPNKPGGHVELDPIYSHYGKQPKIASENIQGKYSKSYVGDQSVLAFNSEAQAKVWVPKINKAIQFLRNNDEAGFEAYAKSELGIIPYDTFKGWFFERTDKNGAKIAPFLSKDHDIEIVPNGKSTTDVNPKIKDPDSYGVGITDSTQSPYDLSRHINVGFTGERGDYPLHTIAENFTNPLAKPLYNFEPAKTIDALPMLSRALGKATSARYLDAYQTGAVESWVKEFGHLINATEAKKANNPLYYFHNWDPYKNKSGLALTGADSDELKTAALAQQKIKAFLGNKSESAKWYDQLTDKLVNTIYNYDPQRTEFARKTFQTIGNADDYIRYATFKSTMGFWNVPQFFVQLQTYALTASVAGARAAFPALPATYFAHIARFTEDANVIAGFDKKLVNFTKGLGGFRWREGEFTEAYNAMKSSGIYNVGGEVANLNYVTDPKLWQGFYQKFVPFGDSPFNEGERSARLAGYFSVYREWRAKNIGKEFDDAAQFTVLKRADDLTANMTRASNSALQSGAFSVPLQFFTYAQRFGELMWSDKLTKTEKARVLLTQIGLYGVPTGLLGSLGIPAADNMRKTAMESGADLNSNVSRQFFDGFISAAIANVTGSDVNVSGKWGNQGLNMLKDIVAGDKSWWEAAMGASSTLMKNVVRTIDPVWHAMASLYQDGGESFPFSSEDLIDAASAINTAKQLTRGIVAINTGKWLSTRGDPITDVTPYEAAAMTLFGFSPQDSTDQWLMTLSAKDRKKEIEGQKKYIIQDINRGFKALEDNDPNTADAMFKRGATRSTIAGFGPDDWADTLARAGKDGILNTTDKIQQNFIEMGTTPEERNERRQRYIEKLQRRGK